MNEFIILLALSILFVLLAFAGLAIKSFFNKTPSLRGCGGSGNKGSCGCSSAQNECSTEVN